MKWRIFIAAILGLLCGWWLKGLVDSDSCYDAGGVWEKRGDYCYGARSADS